MRTSNVSYSYKRAYTFVQPKCKYLEENDPNDVRNAISPTNSSLQLRPGNGTFTVNGVSGSAVNQALNGPIIDTEVSNVITVNSGRNLKKLPSSLKASQSIENVDLISHLSPLEVFDLKITICFDTFDFTKPNEDVALKDQKTKILCELVQFFEQSNEAKKLPEELQEKTLQMIEANIMRPPAVIAPSPILLDFSTVFVEPSWTQLFYVYQILNRFVSLYPKSKLLTLDFFKKMLNLSNIPDNNERLQILAFLRIYYDTHPPERRTMIDLVKAKLMDIFNMDGLPFCITPLLVFLSHIYLRCNKQPPYEYYTVIKYAVFPLIVSPFLPLFHPHLVSLLTVILPYGNPLVAGFHQSLVKTWPTSNGQKQGCYMELILMCMTKIDEPTLTDAVKGTLQIMKEVLTGQQSKSIEVVIEFILGKKEDWVIKHSRRIVLALYDTIKDLSTSHWSPIIREKATAAMVEFGKLDRKSFLKARQTKPIDILRKHYETEKATVRGWQKVIYSVDDVNEEDQRKFVASVKEKFPYKKKTV